MKGGASQVNLKGERSQVDTMAGHEAARHIAATVGKQREMNAAAHLTFSLVLGIQDHWDGTGNF